MACKRKKRYLASPETKEMHTQLRIEYCFSPVRLAEIKTTWYLVLATAGHLLWGDGHTGAHLQGAESTPSRREDHTSLYATHP